MEICPLDEVIASIVGAAGGWATKTEVSVGALKVSELIALLAKSTIVPRFRSKVVETAMPSPSISFEEAATV
jgi:hypothetical protein